MGNWINEEERSERTVRCLMKLPDNRHCINCNNLGPQYVCTTFSTFVCLNCSGIHREFTHRVKSVSVSKFTEDEVFALRAGGNGRARQMYFRDLDLQRHSFPDSSNLHKLREFIKNVYVDRKYSGDRGGTGLSRLFSNNKSDADKSKKTEPYRPINRFDQELYEKSCARRIGKSDTWSDKGNYNVLKMPPPSQVDPRNGTQRKNPVKFEIVDDRFRDDRSESRRFSSDTILQRRSSFGDTKRPLQDILAESFPNRRVGEVSKESNGELADSSARNQESAVGKPEENKIVNLQSLIDFDTETEPTKKKSPSLSTSTSQVSVASSGKQSSSPVSQAPQVKTLESLLFELSVPSVNLMDDMAKVAAEREILSRASRDSVDCSAALPAPVIPQLLDSVDNIPDQLLQPTSNDSTIVSATDEWTLKSVEQQQESSLALVTGSSSLSTSSEGSNVESSFALEQEKIGSLSIVEYQALPEETKPSNRVELPMDLFTANYLPMTGVAPASAWQTGPPHATSFNYYPNTMSVPVFPNRAKSTNPFDISDDELPSMAPSQGSLPNVMPGASGFLHTSSLGIYSSQLTVPQTQASSAYFMPHQSPYPGSIFSPYAYMGQAVHNNTQTHGPQGIDGFGNGGSVFVSMNTAQQPPAIYSGHANPSSSFGGNPFG